jgi:protein O-GlcNAc transferase
LVDLSGHTALNRLPVFARKPAPIQVTWLGDCATTGLTSIDYILCDNYGVHKGDERFYVETPWVLPNTRLCFTPPTEKVPVTELSALSTGSVTFGCFNNLIKMTDQVVVLWARILMCIPNSRLMLKSLSFYDPQICQRVVERFAIHGVAPDRLLLTLGKHREEYFADYNQVDIALDPFPFTGGTTSIDAIWMGVPVITLRGNTMGARQGEGILNNIGLPDWIAKDEDDYVALAVKKAADLAALSRLRSELRSKLELSPLCDAKSFAQNLEGAFVEMWKNFCKNN